MLLEEETGELTIQAGVGISKRAQRLVRLKPGEGISGKVASTAKPLLINDVSKDFIYKEFLVEKERPRETILSLPLIFQGNVLGVITLSNKVTGKPFFHQDEVLLSTLANQAAVAIANANLYQEAVTDERTKLYLPRYYLRRLDEEIERARRYRFSLSVLRIEIDHLQEYKKRYGEEAGAIAMVYLARLLKRCTRRSDIQAVWPHEGFAVILPQIKPEDAVKLARRLVKVTEAYTRVAETMGRKTLLSGESSRTPEKLHQLTVSIGVGSCRERDTGRDVMGRVGTLLEKAKYGGGNRVVAG